jgi:S1-C subfamily serine protease
MADVHGRGAFAGSAPKIAIGAAIAALLTSVIAVIVVATRSSSAPERTTDGSSSTGSLSGSSSGSSRASAAKGALPPDQRVSATDVVKLKREAVSAVYDAGKVQGVKVIDGEVRRALGLEADDVITALSGRTIKREYDVYDAVLGMSLMDASAIYVELLRGGKPQLVRWQLDGDLRSARRNDTRSSLGSLGGSLGGGSLGGGSLGGGSLGGLGGTSDPYGFGAPPDPLVDSIKKIDDNTYEVPRATVDRVFSSTSTYARIARTLPSYRSEGFRVYGIRPNTLVAAIGIRNGDSIRAINAHEVNTIDEAVELYQQIKDAKEWRIDITRRGRPELITISIK